jgi:hypothetical protein
LLAHHLETREIEVRQVLAVLACGLFYFGHGKFYKESKKKCPSKLYYKVKPHIGATFPTSVGMGNSLPAT